MSIEDNKQVIRRHFEEVYNNRNVEYAEAVYLPEAVVHDPILPMIPPGPGGIKEYIRTYFGPVPDLQIEVLEMIGEGDLVAARWKARGTHGGKLLGLPASGRFAEISGLSMYLIVNGRIAESWTQWDAIGMLKELGYELKMKREEAPPAAS